MDQIYSRSIRPIISYSAADNIESAAYWPHTAHQGPKFPPNRRPNGHVTFGSSLSRARNTSIRLCGAFAQSSVDPLAGNRTVTANRGKGSPATAHDYTLRGLQRLQEALQAALVYSTYYNLPEGTLIVFTLPYNIILIFILFSFHITIILCRITSENWIIFLSCGL